MDTRLHRRTLLTAAAIAAPAAADAAAKSGTLPEVSTQEPGAERSYSGMNVLLFITDQQRATRHFPDGWEAANLPGLTRLKQHGLSFTNAFCNACMCSPSRATLFTGLFPAQHGVKYTLEVDMPADEYPQVELAVDLPNLATVMKTAGYAVPYKGKWHLNKAAANVQDAPTDPPCVPDEGWVPEDVTKYGFQRWNPQDAGANQDICQAGGGVVDNDDRYMHDDGAMVRGHEGIIPYLTSAAAKEQPFFLTVSLVNPHDVLSYPKNYEGFGYTDADLASTGIVRPETADEDMSTKPRAQREFIALTNAGGYAPSTPEEQTNYLNFYGNLIKKADAHLVEIIETLEAQGLLDNTLIIATSDHGDMGCAHGGMIQKNFNFYEETIRVPLVYSNPKLFPMPITSNALVSHVDFVPTMASLLGVPKSGRSKWQGVDYSAVLKRPKSAKAPQKYIAFTFDDWQGGQNSGTYVKGANHIASIRKSRYKLARYYDPSGKVPDVYEMYDLKLDPLETRNLGSPDVRKTKRQMEVFRKLRKQLAMIERTRLRPST